MAPFSQRDLSISAFFYCRRRCRTGVDHLWLGISDLRALDFDRGRHLVAAALRRSTAVRCSPTRCWLRADPSGRPAPRSLVPAKLVGFIEDVPDERPAIARTNHGVSSSEKRARPAGRAAAGLI
jgi:hypothetical protein